MPRGRGGNGWLPLPHMKPWMAVNRERIKRDIIVIGASAGGVQTLTQLFGGFPFRMPAAVGVVLHRGAAPGELARVLRRRSRLPVIEPEGRMPLRHGIIYLAPADHHLLFERDAVVAHRGPKEHGTRPAIDPLFRSAAEAHGRRVVGALLTGCGDDGVSGLISIAGGSGLTIAQDPEEAYMPYMPLNALRYDDLSALFSIDNMATNLAALAAGETIRSTSRAAG
ncbi:MAG TPA: chemotaxis protein CheB [Nitrospira sp.]|nr:chemotaxis protein CheB [Nitrospira sp.]